LGRRRRLLRWVEPRQALILESQIAESSGQTERDEEQQDFADAPVVSGFFFVEQVVKIGTGRGVRVDAQARAFARCASARSGVVQAQKRWPTDRGRALRNGTGRFLSGFPDYSGSRWCSGNRDGLGLRRFSRGRR
jgi:hypothetical protein